MVSDGGIGGAGDPSAGFASGPNDSRIGDSRAGSSFSKAMDDASHSALSESPDNQPNNENGDGDVQEPTGTGLWRSVDDDPSPSSTSWDSDVTDPTNEIITVADNRKINKRVPADRFDDLKDIREEDRARDLRRGGRLRVRDMSEDFWQRQQDRVQDQMQFAEDEADRLIREQEMKEQELKAQQADELDAGIQDDRGTKEPAHR